MLGLIITLIEIVAETNNGTFSVKIPFKKGLNIIRAENSSGKSTCINAIAYGLGLEAILGPSRKRPFPKSLYEEIFDNKKEENPYFVHTSCVYLAIRNQKNEEALLARHILGDSQKISVFADKGEEKEDYFLGSAGSVGSAKSEKGFHNWLAKFLDWDLPNVVTFDGKETKLYLECIFPLFFIEQKRGWSEIQANTPTNYGIKNVKKAAIEFCLNIDSFEHDKRVAQLKRRIEAAENEWKNLINNAEGVADFNSVIINKLGDLNKKETQSIRFSYLENRVPIRIEQQKISIKRALDKLSNEIAVQIPDNDELHAEIAVMRVLRRQLEEKLDLIEAAILSMSEIDSKLNQLEHDHDQYKQLQRLKKVGSRLKLDLETKKCPICENDLYDTLGNRNVKREPMTLEENIEFLKSQMDFFSSIKTQKAVELQELQSESKLLNSRVVTQKDKIATLREDIDDVHGETKSLIREKLYFEGLLKEASKLLEIEENLNEQANRIHIEWKTASDSLKLEREDTGILNPKQA